MRESQCPRCLPRAASCISCASVATVDDVCVTCGEMFAAECEDCASRPSCPTCSRTMRPHGFIVVGDRDREVFICDGEGTHGVRYLRSDALDGLFCTLNGGA